MRESDEAVADLARARADVVAAGPDVDLVVAHDDFERAVDDALVRRPQPPHRRIGEPGMIRGVAVFDGAEQAIRARAAWHASEQRPRDAPARVADDGVLTRDADLRRQRERF